MITQFSPPHVARKDDHDGHWRVYNAAGGIEYEAECREDAETHARFLDAYALLQRSGFRSLENPLTFKHNKVT
jgi:hypothetical protein